MPWQRVFTLGIVLPVIGITCVGAIEIRGRKLNQAKTPITCDEAGQPMVGGEKSLNLKPTKQGFLLTIVDKKGNERFLAYDGDGKSDVVTAVEKINDHCYWKIDIQKRRSGGRDSKAILAETTYFLPQKGMFEKHILARDAADHLVLYPRDRLTETLAIYHYSKYEDLSDGK